MHTESFGAIRGVISQFKVQWSNQTCPSRVKITLFYSPIFYIIGENENTITVNCVEYDTSKWREILL